MTVAPQFAIISALIGALSALIVTSVKPWIERRLRERFEKAAFQGELVDIYRHLCANKAILDAIEWEHGLPLDMHFKKLCIPENTLLFSDETFRNLPQLWLQKIYELRLLMRNINIEVEELLRSSRRSNVKQTQALVSYISVKLTQVMGSLSNAHLEFFNQRVPINRNEQSMKTPRLILYKS